MSKRKTVEPPRRWYSASVEPTWSPQDGVNADYVAEVERVRQAFGLVRVAKGVDEPTDPDHWFPYKIGGEQVYVRMRRFMWGQFSPKELQYGPEEHRIAYRSAIFTAFLQVGKLEGSAGQRPIHPLSVRCFFDSLSGQPPVVLECPYAYREVRPDVFITKPGRYEGHIHSYHWYDGGKLCLNPGPSAWSGNKRHLVTAIEMALQWIVWLRQAHPALKWGS